VATIPGVPSPLPAPRPAFAVACFAAAFAAAAPTLLAFNVSPSPTFLNQALALAGFGVWLVVAGRTWRAGVDRCATVAARRAAALLAALALVAAAVAASWAFRALPAPLAWSAAGLVGAAAVAAWAGASMRTAGAAFCAAWALAALLNVGVAGVQVFAPELADGEWIARSGIPGRAVGNLRQPNHLSTVLLWGAIGTAALLALWCARDAEPERPGRRRAGIALLAAVFAAIVFGVVTTASRTGLVGVALLAAWGLVDRRLPRPVRGLLVASPLLYFAAFQAMALWAQATQQAFGGAARLGESDVSGSRFGIWANTLALIAAHPLAGTGFGNFNFAWTLTPFPGRPTAFFDHTHNLPLHLAAELGLPLAVAITALLALALALGLRRAWRAEGDEGTTARAAAVMVLLAALHSGLEYPLWYAYFLLPAAWALGHAMAAERAEPLPSTLRDARARSAERGAGAALAAGGLALTLGAAAALADYARVVAIFAAPADAPPLVDRIAEGQRSVFFAHHADYAAVTSGVLPAAGDSPLARAVAAEAAFARATHYLLDTRLMVAWARHLAATGREPMAQHLAERLREFRHPQSEALLGVCEAPAGAASAAAAPADTRPAFPCQPPPQPVPWQAFLAR
jgi:O-antigen ligase